MSKRTTWLTALAALAFGLVVALGIYAWPDRVTSQTEVVRMAYPPIVASLPVFIAERNQVFQQQSITAQKTSFTSSNDMVNALIAGQVDVLPAVSLVPIIHLEIQHPGRVRLFSHSRMRPSNAFDGVIVAHASPIRALADLAGKKIGVFPGSSAMNMFKAFLRKHGVDPATVTFVQLAPPAQLASLSSGAVDALFTYEPVTTTAEQQGGYRRIFGSVYADLLDPCPIGASVISRDFERRNPDAARRAIQAIDESVRIMREQPVESKGLLPQFAQLPTEIASRVNVVDVTFSSEVDVASLQRFIDLLHEVGEIPERIDARRLIEPTR